MLRILMAVALVLGAVELGYTAELEQSDRSRGWQDRAYFSNAYAEYELAGGDGAAAGDSGDAGSSAGDGGNGDSGASGEGCSR